MDVQRNVEIGLRRNDVGTRHEDMQCVRCRKCCRFAKKSSGELLFGFEFVFTVNGTCVISDEEAFGAAPR